MPNETQWLTVAEIAHRVGLAERTIRALIASGRLPAVRLQGVRAVRVPASAVMAMIVARGSSADHYEGDGDDAAD